MSDGHIGSFSGEDYATAFTKALTCQINKEDVGCMVQTQKEMYVLFVYNEKLYFFKYSGVGVLMRCTC